MTTINFLENKNVIFLTFYPCYGIKHMRYVQTNEFIVIVARFAQWYSRSLSVCVYVCACMDRCEGVLPFSIHFNGKKRAWNKNRNDKNWKNKQLSENRQQTYCLYVCTFQTPVCSGCFSLSLLSFVCSLFVCFFNLILLSSSHKHIAITAQRIKCILRPLIPKNFVRSSTINSTTISRTFIPSHVGSSLVELYNSLNKKKCIEPKKQRKTNEKCK